ncbi:tRNA dimethylallyltransferase [compost metagenome]
MKKVIFVVGATASGKSDWALRLAEEFHGVIINCDSVQVYQHLEIGAAKATKEERARIPHYLIDYVAPPNEMTAGVYGRDFNECMKNLPDDKPIFVVGGTGFYFMAIEKGMYPVIPVPPEIQKQILVEMAEEGGPERLHQEMLDADPVYGAKIAKADHYRIGRALELIRSQKKSVTQIQADFEASREKFPHDLLKIGPEWDRDAIRERIRQRTAKMIELGLIEEVQRLIEKGLDLGWAPLASVGYKETLQFIRGEITKEQLQDEITINTQQLAKKQKTWFQRDPEINWFPGDKGFDSARALVEKFLTS